MEAETSGRTLALTPKAEPRLSPAFLVPEAGLFPGRLGGRWEEGGVGWELGPEKPAGQRDLEFEWPSSGKAQLGRSQGIYYAWSPAPNRADGWSCSSSYKQLGLPPLRPSPLSATTAPTASGLGGGSGDDQGKERRSEESRRKGRRRQAGVPEARIRWRHVEDVERRSFLCVFTGSWRTGQPTSCIPLVSSASSASA